MKGSNLVLVIVLIAAAFGFYILYEKNKLTEQQQALAAAGQANSLQGQISSAAGSSIAGLITTLGSSATSWLSSLGSLSGSPAGSAAPITSGSSTTQVGPQPVSGGSAPVSISDINSDDWSDLSDDNSFDDSESL